MTGQSKEYAELMQRLASYINSGDQYPDSVRGRKLDQLAGFSGWVSDVTPARFVAVLPDECQLNLTLTTTTNPGQPVMCGADLVFPMGRIISPLQPSELAATIFVVDKYLERWGY